MQEKQASVDAFQKNPKTDVIICSIKAASAGITLTAASDVAFIELPWTYADCDQAESRAHRIGQDKQVIAYRFITQGSIEEKILQLQDEKRKLAETFVTDSETLPALSSEQWVDLLK